jgi:hypothetical protein
MDSAYYIHDEDEYGYMFKHPETILIAAHMVFTAVPGTWMLPAEEGKVVITPRVAGSTKEMNIVDYDISMTVRG